MKIAYNVNPETNYFSLADVGWVVGHSIGVYGSLIRGATTTMYEGKPILPDAGVIWKICEKH
jgi:propionyl-CoA synthetase